MNNEMAWIQYNVPNIYSIRSLRSRLQCEIPILATPRKDDCPPVYNCNCWFRTNNWWTCINKNGTLPSSMFSMISWSNELSQIYRTLSLITTCRTFSEFKRNMNAKIITYSAKRNAIVRSINFLWTLKSNDIVYFKIHISTPWIRLNLLWYLSSVQQNDNELYWTFLHANAIFVRFMFQCKTSHYCSVLRFIWSLL